jgi:hypothetical protein
MQPNLGPDHDLALRLTNLESNVAALNTRDVLQNASIGAGGITVNGGKILITNGGSIEVDGTGVITLPTGTLSASHVVGTTDVTAGGNVVAGGDVDATSGSVNTNNVNATNANLSGTVYSTYMHNNPVVSGYVAVYVQGSDGRVGASPSALRFKQDIRPKHYSLAQLALIQVVNYRLIAAVAEHGDSAAVEVGVVAEQLIEAGMPEFVAFTETGETLSVHYERLVLVAIGAMQELAEDHYALRAEVQELRDAISRK